MSDRGRTNGRSEGQRFRVESEDRLTRIARVEIQKNRGRMGVRYKANEISELRKPSSTRELFILLPEVGVGREKTEDRVGGTI